jgi:hypothetical protein
VREVVSATHILADLTSDALIQRYGSFVGSRNLGGGGRSQREPVSVATFPAFREKNREIPED